MGRVITRNERKGEIMEMSELIPLKEVHNYVPAPGGNKVSLPTVWRWVTLGVKGVRLEAVRYGRRWFTTQAALDTFSRQLAEKSISDLEKK